MTNPKIEKVKAAIAKTRAKIAQQSAKLREQERQLTILEDAEIVARFRRESLTEDDLNAIIRQKSGRAEALHEDGAEFIRKRDVFDAEKI